jgi:predicted RNase H-like nuclease (RuvC/YqgF family)
LIKEKYVLTKDHNFKNNHERDSLSAAVYAYRIYKNKFERILKRAHKGIDKDELRAQIIGVLSLEQALSRINKITPTTVQTSTKPDEFHEIIFDERDRQITQQEETIRRLRTLVETLTRESSGKDKIISAFRRKLNAEQKKQHTELLAKIEIIERDREQSILKKQLRKEEHRCKNLRVRLDRMKRYIALQAGENCITLKILPQLSRQAVRSLDDEMGLGEEDLLYVQQINGWGRNVARELTEAKIKTVILSQKVYARAWKQYLIGEFRDARLPILSDADLSSRIKGKIGVVDSVALEKALAIWNASQVVYSKEKKDETIDSMIKEYHVERTSKVREPGLDQTTPISEQDLRNSLESGEKRLVKIVVREYTNKKMIIPAAHQKSVPKFMNLEEKEKCIESEQ